MVVISENQFDGGLAGLDGNLTQVSQHVDASTARVTTFGFDWRDRQVHTTAAQDWYTVTTLDNLDRATQMSQYAQATGKLINQSQKFYRTRNGATQLSVHPNSKAAGAIDGILR